MPDSSDNTSAELKNTLDQLSKLLTHRTRFGICVLLSIHGKLSFRRLKDLLDESDGSLGGQLRKLEDEGFINIEKEFRNRRPVTWYKLTKIGESELKKHLDSMEKIIIKSKIS